MLLNLAPNLSNLKIWKELSGLITASAVKRMQHITILNIPIHNMTYAEITQLQHLKKLERLVPTLETRLAYLTTIYFSSLYSWNKREGVPTFHV